MRIRDVRTIQLEYPLPQPVFDANYLMATKPALLVEVVDRTGHVELSERPGLGIELNPRVIAKYRVDG